MLFDGDNVLVSAVSFAVGAFVTIFIRHRFGVRLWEKQADHRLARFRYEEGLKLFRTIADQIGARYYYSKAIIICFKNRQWNKGNLIYENEYQDSVKSWEIASQKLRSMLMIIVDINYIDRIFLEEDLDTSGN